MQRITQRVLGGGMCGTEVPERQDPLLGRSRQDELSIQGPGMRD